MLTELIPQMYLTGEPGVDLQTLLASVDTGLLGLTLEATRFPLTTRDPVQTRLITQLLDALGNPFRIDLLTLEQQRILIAFLLWAHANRGIPEVIGVIAKEVMNLDVRIQDGTDVAWMLGVAKLGVDTELLAGAGGGYLVLTLDSDPAENDVQVLRSIAEYIKPANHALTILVLDGGFGIGTFGVCSFGG